MELRCRLRLARFDRLASLTGRARGRTLRSKAAAVAATVTVAFTVTAIVRL